MKKLEMIQLGDRETNIKNYIGDKSWTYVFSMPTDASEYMGNLYKFNHPHQEHFHVRDHQRTTFKLTFYVEDEF